MNREQDTGRMPTHPKTNSSRGMSTNLGTRKGVGLDMASRKGRGGGGANRLTLGWGKPGWQEKARWSHTDQASLLREEQEFLAPNILLGDSWEREGTGRPEGHETLHSGICCSFEGSELLDLGGVVGGPALGKADYEVDLKRRGSAREGGDGLSRTPTK